MQEAASAAARTLMWTLPSSVTFRFWSSTFTESKKFEPSIENWHLSVPVSVPAPVPGL